jgi:hypothetical protein
MSHDIKNNMLTCPDVLRVVFEKCDATSFTGVMFTNKLNYHVCDDILRERSEALVAAENGDADRLRTLFLQNNNASLTSSIRHPDHIRALIRIASRRGHASVVDVICDYAPITHNEVHEAAFGGNVSIVMKLIRRLLSSNVSCNGEVYALDGAIKTGNVELVKAICDNYGNRISRVVASSGTFEAFRRGNLDVVKILLDRFLLNDMAYRTPELIRYAVQVSAVMVEEMFRRVNPNMLTINKTLLIATEYNKLDTVHMLVERHGGVVDERALWSACIRGNLPMIKAMCAHWGADMSWVKQSDLQKNHAVRDRPAGGCRRLRYVYAVCERVERNQVANVHGERTVRQTKP